MKTSQHGAPHLTDTADFWNTGVNRIHHAMFDQHLRIGEVAAGLIGFDLDRRMLFHFP